MTVLAVEPAHVNGLELRRQLGRADWAPPVPFGPMGWLIERRDGTARVIATCGPAPDGTEDWRHASISRPDRMPTYDDLSAVHRAVFGQGWAYQVFAPPSAHVNIHAHALHLWGHCDGTPVLPNFGALGTI